MSRARDLSKLLTDGLSSVLADNSIALPKLSNITTDRLVGRDTAGDGAIEQIQVTGGLEFTDAGSLRTTAFTGDVTKTAGGTTTTIANDAVTTAKINNGAVTSAKVDTAGVAVLGTSQEYTRTHNFNATTLTDGANISWDLSQNQVSSVTLGGNRTLSNPTNKVDGAVYILIVRQDGTGGRTLSFSSDYKFAGGTAPTITTTASKADIMTFVCDGTNMYGVSALNC